jgi:hypothetical protein
MSFDMTSIYVRAKEDPGQSYSLRSRLHRQIRARRLRSDKGGQIAELPPALFLLLIVIFFPLVDLLYYCFAYGCTWYLHQLELRAVSVSVPPAGQPAGLPGFDGHQIQELQSKETEFLNSGLGAFLQMHPADVLECQVVQYPDPNNPTVVGTSVLTNRFRVRAMIYIPLPMFNNIPALDSLNRGNINFSYSSTTLQEERGLN